MITLTLKTHQRVDEHKIHNASVKEVHSFLKLRTVALHIVAEEKVWTGRYMGTDVKRPRDSFRRPKKGFHGQMLCCNSYVV